VSGFDWIDAPLAAIDEDARRRAERRQRSLTKPPGSLGRLETIAVDLAALQGRERPRVDRVRIVVFAADHGIAAEGVSAYPQSVTAEMVRNFSAAGAAIAVMARILGADLEVVNVGTVVELPPLPGVVDRRIAAGTANAAHVAAMTLQQYTAAVAAGREAVERAQAAGAELFIAGDMGIANTTSASAVACALLGVAGSELAGPGTGLDAAGVARKAAVIDAALACHADAAGDPHEVLRSMGGFEIAALAGAFVACAQQRIPVLVDGFIASTAALAAMRIRPGIVEWMLLAHRSAEPGHERVIRALGLAPLIDLGLRLGEGTGAAAALPLLRLACALHDGMATFDEAAVSGRIDD